MRPLTHFVLFITFLGATAALGKDPVYETGKRTVLNDDGTISRIDFGTGDATNWQTNYSSFPSSSAGSSTDSGYYYKGTDKNGVTIGSEKLENLVKQVKDDTDITVLKNGKVEYIADSKGNPKNGAKPTTGGPMADPCSISTGINASYACRKTQTLAKATDVSNQVLGSAGRNLVNTIGSTVANKAQDGTQSGAQKGIAQMAKTSFTYETALTGLNVLSAVQLNEMAKKHRSNSKGLDAWLKTKQAECRGDPTCNRNAKLEYDEAKKEQDNASSFAATAALKNTMTGVQSAASAYAAKTTQKSAEKAAAEYKKIEDELRSHQVAFDPSGPVMNGMGTTDPNQFAASADGTETQSSQDSSTDTSTAPTNLLGNGTDLGGGDDSGPAGPLAGTFKPGTAGGPGGSPGSGGPGAAGAPGGGGGGKNDEAKASYASEFGTKEKYETGGIGGAGARGAGGKIGGDKDGGIDLNGLLAQFLPKTKEDLGPENGILDYPGGAAAARMPAGGEEASYLDKNADLFQRIHETMSEKNRKGHVGI